MGVKENKDFLEVAEFVAAEGNRQKEKLKMKISLQKAMIICVAFVLCTAIICGTIFGIIAFREQQWALNAQYADMVSLLAGAEKEIYHANTGDDGAAIVGDENNVAGGDIIDGDSNTNKD